MLQKSPQCQPHTPSRPHSSVVCSSTPFPSYLNCHPLVIPVFAPSDLQAGVFAHVVTFFCSLRFSTVTLDPYLEIIFGSR